MVDNRVYRSIERPDSKLIDELGNYGVATLHESQNKTGLLNSYIHPIKNNLSIAGPAVTVLAHPGDNLMIHAAIAVASPGDILVVSVSSEIDDGMFGELMATSAIARGVGGLIIDAGVRDVAALREMNFPVWSKAICAKGTVKLRGGSVNVPIVCAGRYVCPGDAIVADDDGVVCVRREDVERVIDTAHEREQREAKVRERLSNGELGMDFYGLWALLDEQGVWVEGLDASSVNRSEGVY